MTTPHPHAVDRARRNLLRARRTDAPPPLRPPWTDAARMTAACTRCGECIRACPERVLTSGDGGYPAFDPTLSAGACTFCGACAEACDEAVFDRSATPPWTVRAVLSAETCLAAAGVHCQSCRDACLDGAVTIALRIGGPGLPAINTKACTGCGACVAPCPATAISLSTAPDTEAAA